MTGRKEEVLGLLAKVDPDLYARIEARWSTPPPTRLSSRPRSKTPGTRKSLEDKIDKVLAKAKHDILKLISQELDRDCESGYGSS